MATRYKSPTQRFCQYPITTNPDIPCGQPVSGRGRSKYCCPDHAFFARQLQQSYHAAEQVQEWRQRNPLANFIRKSAARIGDSVFRKYQNPRLRMLATWIVELDMFICVVSLMKDAQPQRFNQPACLKKDVATQFNYLRAFCSAYSRIIWSECIHPIMPLLQNPPPPNVCLILLIDQAQMRHEHLLKCCTSGINIGYLKELGLRPELAEEQFPMDVVNERYPPLTITHRDP
jgi:hypothetical protein